MSTKREHPDGARRGGVQAPPGKGRTKHAGPEEALHESERPPGLRSAGEFQRLKELGESIVETMGEAVLLIDPDGKITFANPRVQVLLGYAPEELTGRHWATIVPADQYPILEDADARRARGEPVRPYELELLHRAGHRVFVNVSATPRRDPGTGRFAGTLAVMTDITERRQAEKLLRIQSDLAIALGSTASLSEALEQVLTAAMQNEGIDCGGIYLVDEATGALHLTVHRGFSARFLETESHYPADAPNARFVAEGTPTYWSSPPHEYSNDVLKREGIRAVASIPIRSEGRVLAALNVASHVRDDFPMPTRHALEAIGAQIGSVIVRARAVEALGESERRHATLAAVIPVGIIRTDAGGNCVYANERWCELVGMSVAQVQGGPWSVAVPPEERARISNAWACALREDRLLSLEHHFRRPDGTSTWVLGQALAERDADGNITGYVGTATDITKRKLAEEALRQEHERLALAQCAGQVGVFDWDPLSDRRIWTPQLDALYGMEPGSVEHTSEDWARRVHPDDLAEAQAAVQQCFRERRPELENDYRIVRPDGEVRWLANRARVTYDAAGKPVRVVGTCADITERKRAEEVLRENEERFRRVVEHISDALIVDDVAGRVVFANDRFLALFGFDRKDLAALVLEDYVAPEHRKALRERHDRRLRGEPVPTHFEYEGIRRDGGRLWLEVDVAPLVDAVGRITGTQSAIRDITERKRAEAALRETQQRLEAILEVTKTGIDVIDHEFNLHYVNPGWQKVYGDPTGRKCYEYFMGRDRPCPTCGIPKALETRQIQVTEETLPRENNRVVEVHTIPFQDASGQWLASELNVDITERKRVEQTLRESEERFRATFEQAAVGIAHVTPEGRFLRVNQRFADILGYTPEELRQHTVHDVTHPEDLAADVAAAQQLLAGKNGTYSLEKRYVRKNGALVWGSLTASLARNAHGEPDYLIGVVEDITARKEAEAARVQAEQRFTQVLENVSAVAVILSSDECITYCNPYLLELTGWSDAEVRGRNWFEVFIPADQRERVRAVFAAGVYEDRLAPHFENDILTRDGRRRLISWSNTALHDAAGRVIGLASLGYDITDRRRAAEAVRIERAKLRGILEAMDDAVCIIDQQHQIVYTNPAFVQQFGLVEGRPCYEYFHGRSDACPWCRNAQVFTGRSLHGEWSSERDGRAYEVSETTLPNEDGTLSKLGILRDVTARREAEAALASRTRELETVMENTPNAIARLNHELRYMFVNRRWVELNGLSPEAAQGRTPAELHVYGESCVLLEETLRQVLAKRQMREVEFVARTAAGERRLQVHAVREAAGREGAETSTVLTITRDVTEERRLQEDLNQAQKMEVVGRLATGIAHDINNVLTAISGYAALARAELPPGHQTGQSLDQVEEAVLQAAGVVRGLLTFSHKMPINRQTVELRNVLVGAARFVKHLLPAAIEVVLEGADGPPLWVSADGVQLQQVILNLAVNARDAMPDGGTLRFTLRADEAGDGAAERPGGSQRFVRLVVSDTGSGIPPEVLPHIFEPFFTTKPSGQGTGLGLATVKSVVEQHGGDVQADSIPGCGAQFTISLPCAEPPSAAEPERTEATRARARGELILVADDNVQVLDVISAGLRQIGYDVLPVTDAPAIHTECARYGNRVKLAILDVDLPGGSGVDALRAIRQVWPVLPAVIITGAVDGDLQSSEDGRTRLLEKPFRLDDLLGVVTELLEQPTDAEVVS